MTDSDPSDTAYRFTLVPYAPEGADYEPAEPQERIADRETLENYRGVEGFHVEDVMPLVPVEALEALVAEWREEYDGTVEMNGKFIAANELEELMESHE